MGFDLVRAGSVPANAVFYPFRREIFKLNTTARPGNTLGGGGMPRHGLAEVIERDATRRRGRRDAPAPRSRAVNYSPSRRSFPDRAFIASGNSSTEPLSETSVPEASPTRKLAAEDIYICGSHPLPFEGDFPPASVKSERLWTLLGGRSVRAST
ncbi:MAG: hypothetical protein ACXQTZ_01100 [Candidatus Alkanophagales archaeon]